MAIIIDITLLNRCMGKLYSEKKIFKIKELKLRI